VAREEWETLLLLRGAIVASFGHVETTLAELAIRLSRDERCAVLRESYPHGLGRRLTFLRACFALTPYVRRRGLAEQVFKRFEAATELRHIMAHGSVKGPSLGWLVTFRDFKPSAGAEIAVRDHRYTYADLEVFAWQAARLSRRVAQLAAHAENVEWLPALDAAPAK
jgi:hypothetical protein